MNRRRFFGALCAVPAAPAVALLVPSAPPVVASFPTAQEIADAVWGASTSGRCSVVSPISSYVSAELPYGS